MKKLNAQLIVLGATVLLAVCAYAVNTTTSDIKSQSKPIPLTDDPCPPPPPDDEGA